MSPTHAPSAIPAASMTAEDRARGPIESSSEALRWRDRMGRMACSKTRADACGARSGSFMPPEARYIGCAEGCAVGSSRLHGSAAAHCDAARLVHAAANPRLLLHPDAELEGVTADQCVESVLRDTAVPKTAA